MSQNRIELTEPYAFRLRRLDLILAELARPSLEADNIGSATRERMTVLGIPMGGVPCRRKLIENVWDRKRDLMQCIAVTPEWGSLPPSA